MLIRSRIQKLEKEIGFKFPPTDPYEHLSNDELVSALGNSYLETYEHMLKKDKAEAEEFKKLFLDTLEVMGRPYHPSVNGSLTIDERKEILQKRLEWWLKRTSDKWERLKLKTIYERYLDGEESWRF